MANQNIKDAANVDYLTGEAKENADLYARYVQLGFSFAAVARERHYSASAVSKRVRKHQRWMAEVSIDPTAGPKFDEQLYKALHGLFPPSYVRPQQPARQPQPAPRHPQQ